LDDRVISSLFLFKTDSLTNIAFAYRQVIGRVEDTNNKLDQLTF